MIRVVAVVGAGTMGRGIAQISAQAGLQVLLFDMNAAAVEAARADIFAQWDKLQQKGKITQHQCAVAKSKLHIVDELQALAASDLVIEAIVENLDIKRDLFCQLDQIVRDDCILATNTSSLSVTAIAASGKLPQRVAGLHFFNPVPLMKVVEVIDGLLTDATIAPRLMSFVGELGHTPVRAKDTPGFIVNHAGRAYVTEALRLLQENVADFTDIDQIMREAAGFRLGPFELMDLTGLDVSHPVMEAIYHQYYEEPRYRPSVIAAQRVQAGILGRKSGRGFYAYPAEPAVPRLTDSAAWTGKVWLSHENRLALDTLMDLFVRCDVVIDENVAPLPQSICIVSPDGEDVSTCVARLGLEARRTFGIDSLTGGHGHLTLMLNPASDPALAEALALTLGKYGQSVSLIQDSYGFVAQRMLASIVNVACDIVQQGICTPQDLDKAVVAGLAYPLGPLAWGDKLGALRILLILRNLLNSTGDPRYRPSPWLVRRAQLGLSLLHVSPSEGIPLS